MMSLDPPSSKKRGRPSLDAHGEASTPVTLRLSDAEYRRLQRAATTLRLSVQDVVRLAVRLNLDTKN